MNLEKFFTELKRRNVYKVAALTRHQNNKATWHCRWIWLLDDPYQFRQV